MFDDSSAASYSIRVEVTDSAGLTFQENFTITVIDASNPGGRLIAVTKVLLRVACCRRWLLQR